MLPAIFEKIEQFLLRLLDGETLAFIQLIILIILALITQRIWKSVSRSPLYKTAAKVLLCLVILGFLFVPDRMMAIVIKIQNALF